MQKIISSLWATVDGVVEAPDQWSFQYGSPEIWEAIQAAMAASDAMLLGRRTYEEFAAVWPGRGSEDPIGAYMNKTSKLVVSTTLDTVEWQNSSLVEGGVEGVARLKERPGGTVNVVGSPTLVRSLLRERLLDELVLLVCPIVVGSGKRLFEDRGERLPLELVGSTPFATGVLMLTYRPAVA